LSAIKETCEPKRREPVFYHWPHELWNIAGGPQNRITLSENSTVVFPWKARKENHVKDRERLILLTSCLSICLSGSFVL